MPIQAETDASITICSNCRTPMPQGLRFCRNCGFRLGEGPAEYTETRRFENGRPVNLADHGDASQQPFATAYGVTGGAMSPATGHQMAKRAKKMSGMTWMFLGLLVFFIAAAAFTAIVTPLRRIPPVASAPAVPKPWVGVSSFEDGEGGVTFDNVTPPGGPADKAGLVGGDIITSFDGQIVHDEDEMTDLVQRTPIGKAVEVIYLRDGESKTTTMTTISKEDFDRLVQDFRNRPEGQGLFGFDDDDIERVPIPGTKTFGVRVDDVTPNRPADLAGVKDGDIILEFDKAPIRTTEEFKARVNRAIPYSTVTVALMRGAERLEILVKMGKK
ncbi:MAG: PDZ domain-containing protein [Pyrinomonadaceae bacterium]|nr:PDZ domain-containing protein [Pyrinomonadaceae bacterium]